MVKVSWEDAEEAFEDTNSKLYADDKGVHITDTNETWGPLVSITADNLESLLEKIIYARDHADEYLDSEAGKGVTSYWADIVFSVWGCAAEQALGIGNSYAAQEWVIGDYVTMALPHAFESKEARDKWVAELTYIPSEEGSWRRRAISNVEADVLIEHHGCELHGDAEYTDAMYESYERGREEMAYGEEWGEDYSGV